MRAPPCEPDRDPLISRKLIPCRSCREPFCPAHSSQLVCDRCWSYHKLGVAIAAFRHEQ